MNLAPHPLRGPAGRRALLAAGVTGLLIAGLVAGESSDAHPPQPAQRGPAALPAKLTPAELSGHAGAAAAGTRLLDQAAAAARQVSYRGVQVISWLTPGGHGAWLGSGPAALSMDVAHRTGQPPDGMLGLTPVLVRLLRTHYAVMYAGQGSAAGRPACIVEVLRRRDGSIAARFWLDMATKLPLRRELYDTHARLVSVDDITGLELSAPAAGHGRQAGRHGALAGKHTARAGSQTATAAAGAATRSPVITTFQHAAVARLPDAMSMDLIGGVPPAASSPATAARPWADRLGSGQLAALRAGGWPAPAAMPGGLTLLDASQASTPTGRVVDLAYSDGLSVVSLFVQRGRLPASLPGWRQADLGGHPLLLRDLAEPDLTWSAGGYVFTVVAGAPAPIVAGVLNSLPYQPRPGLWSRMWRGIRRLLSWADPFR